MGKKNFLSLCFVKFHKEAQMVRKGENVTTMICKNREKLRGKKREREERRERKREREERQIKP